MSAERAPVRGDRHIRKDRDGHSPGTVSWGEHLEAWGEYSRRYGDSQSAERIAQRGGFSYFELVQFLDRFPMTWCPTT